MAKYRPDYKLKQAKEVLDSLPDTKENNLIKYYISKQRETITSNNEKLEEYREFFKMLNKFLPKHNILRA